MGGCGGTAPSEAPNGACENLQCVNGHVSPGLPRGPFFHVKRCNPLTAGGVECVTIGPCPSENDALDAGSCTGVDTSKDPLNCAACGRPCKPTTLAKSANTFPRAVLAVDDLNVYWTAEDAVLKVPQAGGEMVVIASETIETSPTGLAVDAARVYWSVDHTASGEPASSLKAVPIEGGAPATLASGLARIRSNLVVKKGKIYWSSEEAAGALMTMPTSGGTPTMLASGIATFTIAVDATSVYFTTTDGSDKTQGAVEKIALNGGPPIKLFSAPSLGSLLTIDAAYIYSASFSASGQGIIMKVPIAGGTPVTLATNQNFSNYLVVDASNVYWTNFVAPVGAAVSGSVVKVALDGGEPTILAARQGSPGPIAVRGTAVYWLNEFFDSTVQTIDTDPCRNGVCQ